jgi:UMF1 family MFS transporter
MAQATLTFQKNNARVINAWCSYDWANSVYSLTISSAIFPVYYNAATRSAFGGDQVLFFGLPVENTVLYSYALSVSFLVIAFCSPLLSGIADYGGMKKKMMKAFTLLGSGSCIALFFFTGQNIEFGIIACTLASVGWAGSIVFYNAYLPEIATADRFDRISARGFSMGYIGSVIQLVISLVIVMQPGWFGIADDGLAARLSFLFVGIWWIGFAQIAFYFLPGNIHHRAPQDFHYLKKGYQELRKVWMAIQQNPPIKRFIPSFFFYNMGVQTVMLLAATFGEKELGLAADKLIITILLIQLVAIAGAYLFAKVSELYGNKLSLLVMIAIWIGICLYAYLVKTDTGFYFLAVVVGMVMGGIQSLSRSTYSKLLPRGTTDTASYFSFYDVTDKISIVAGTFLYGLIEHLTGNMRFSALALACFFLIGLLLMLRFRMQP